MLGIESEDEEFRVLEEQLIDITSLLCKVDTMGITSCLIPTPVIATTVLTIGKERGLFKGETRQGIPCGRGSWRGESSTVYSNISVFNGCPCGEYKLGYPSGEIYEGRISKYGVREGLDLCKYSKSSITCYYTALGSPASGSPTISLHRFSTLGLSFCIESKHIFPLRLEWRVEGPKGDKEESKSMQRLNGIKPHWHRGLLG